MDITKRKIDWKYDVKDRIGNDIVVSKDYVYIRFSKNWLLSLSKATGNENLSIKRDQDYFSLSVLNDNLILTEKFHIAGLESKSLEENWRVSTSILPSPFAIDKGIIYARVARDSMSATEIKSGKELWRRDIDYSMFNPLIGLNDDLYVIGEQTITVVDNYNGETLFKYNTKDKFRAQPMLYDSVIYCGGFRYFEPVKIYYAE